MCEGKWRSVTVVTVSSLLMHTWVVVARMIFVYTVSFVLH